MINLNFKSVDGVLKNFFEFRLSSNKYRGLHLFQHNRIQSEKIKWIYKSFTIINSNNDFIEIPSGDEWTSKNKHGFFICEYPMFRDFLLKFNELSKKDDTKRGIGTPNSMKKNLFPDLEKLKIINRYDEKLNLVTNSKLQTPKYFKMNQDFVNNVFIKKTKTLEKHINEQINVLFSDLIHCLYSLLSELGRISEKEFMYFVSWLNMKYNEINMDEENVLKLIEEYRKLNNNQKILLDYEISLYANPKKWNKKIEKRDFHNWKNQSQEIFDIFKSNFLFQTEKIRNETNLTLNINISENEVYKKRAIFPKKEYFLKHKVEKDLKFELDHIIPFGYIKDLQSYLLIDNWQNLIYLDSNTHSIKTNSNNKFQILGFSNTREKLLMKSIFDQEFIELNNLKNVMYNDEIIDEIITYNKMLLDKL